MSTLRGGELPQSARVPAWLIALSIVSFTVAPRLGELFFIGAVVAAAVLGRPSADDRLRARRLGLHALFLAGITIWLAARIEPPWGSGLHTLTAPTNYPVTFLDYAPFLWAFFILSWQRFDARDLRLMQWALVAVVPVYAVLVFGQLHLAWEGSWSWRPFGLPVVQLDLYTPLPGRATGGHANANILALSALYGLVAAMTLLAVDWFEQRAGRRAVVPVALAVAVALSFWMLLRTGSRIPLGVAAALLVGAALWLAPRLRLMTLCATLVGGGLLWLSVSSLGPATTVARAIVPRIVWGRIAGVEDLAPSPLRYRIRVWSCAVDLVRERPLLGWGLGRLAPECERRLNWPAHWVNHAHNLPLQMAAELGLPLAALLCGWMLWMISDVLMELRRAPPSAERLLRAGLVVIVVVVLLVSQFNLAVAHDNRLEVVYWASIAMLGPWSRHRLTQVAAARTSATGTVQYAS